MATNSGGRGPRQGPDSLVEVNEVRDVRRRLGELLSRIQVFVSRVLIKIRLDVSGYLRALATSTNVPPADGVGVELVYIQNATLDSGFLVCIDRKTGVKKPLFVSVDRMGIGGAPAVGSILDLQSTTGALIVPRMTTAQRNALTAADAMIVYDTTLGSFYKRQAGAWAAF